MRRAYIIGNGGHAKVIASLLDREVTFIDRCDEDDFFDRIEEARNSDVFLGIGNSDARRKIYAKLGEFGIEPATCIAKNAFIAKTAFIGPGTVICPGAVVMTNAIIGPNVIINTLSGIDHDCVVGEHSQIAGGVSFCGQVKVGRGCFFGVRSAVFPRVSIGDNVIVRGGSLIIKDVPAKVMVGGNPAMILKEI